MFLNDNVLYYDSVLRVKFDKGIFMIPTVIKVKKKTWKFREFYFNII